MMYKTFIVYVILHAFLVGCDNNSAGNLSQKTYNYTPSLVCGEQPPDIIPSTKEFLSFEKALDGANQLLKGVSDYVLTTDTAHLSKNSIYVQIVDTYPAGKYRLSVTPRGKKCILIDASLLYNAIYEVSGRTPPDDGENENMAYLDDEPAYIFIVIYVLLHEVGHIEFDTTIDIRSFEKKRQEICDKILYSHFDEAQKSRTNASCFQDKSIEILADKFATHAIRSMILGDDNLSIGRVIALRVEMALVIAAMNIILKHAEEREGRNRTRDTFLDEGVSHPNTELRLLLVLSEIDKKYEYMLYEFLQSRSGVIPEDRYKEFSNLSNDSLITKLTESQTSWNDQMVVTELLGERKAIDGLKPLTDLYQSIKKTEMSISPQNYKSKSSIRTLKNTVILSLASLNDASVKPIVIDEIRSREHSTVVASIEAAGVLGLLEVVEIIAEKAMGDSRLVKLPAIEALGKLHTPKSYQTLLILLGEESYIGLEYVVSALLEHENTETIDHLQYRLDQRSENEPVEVLEIAISTLQAIRQ